jgi:polygalacturonase
VAYPATPGARAGVGHRVHVQGIAIDVERHAGVAYARFAMLGRVTVEVEVDEAIRGFVIFPQRRVESARVDHSRLSFVLAAPGSVVIRIVGLELLFVLPDSLRDDPLAGEPGVVDVLELGADGSGRSLVTATLQAALTAASERPGGGTVLLPPGVYRTGTLRIGSNVRLHLAPGSLLLGSRDPADYPLDEGQRESAADETLAPDARFLGRTMTFSRLLLVDRADNVRITGGGTIDGQGAFLRKRGGLAPNLLRIRESTNVTVRDVLFRDSAAWSLHILASGHVEVRNVKVINDRSNLNTDGIDPDMSSDVLIDGSFVYTKDDAICVKASGNGGLRGDVRRIAVTDNLVSSVDAALKVGTESEAASFSDIRFEDNHVFDSGRAMSIVVRDGATYEGLAFRGLEVGPNVAHLIEQVIGVRDPEAALGRIRDLSFEDVSAASYQRPASNWTWYAQFRPGRPSPDEDVNVFEGADAANAVDGLVLRRVVVNGHHLRNRDDAAAIANLTIGSYVRRVRFE